MTINEWLVLAEEELEVAGVGTARLDAMVLLEHVTGRDRAKLLAEPDAEINTADTAQLAKLLTSRTEHTPIAYLIGYTEFYGRKFVVTADVLDPRPESETMIDLLKDILGSASSPDDLLSPGDPDDDLVKEEGIIKIADVGTGSGALGITAKLELPKIDVELLDIDDDAVKIAKINVDKYTMGATVIRSDLLIKSGRDNDILLCNLPYVPDDYQINQAAGKEPRIAIFGGPDGLDIYRRLFAHLDKLQKRPLYILTECLPTQQRQLIQIAADHDYNVEKSEDFILVFKLAE